MTTKPKYRDFPFDDILDAVAAHAENGSKCYQKFTCEHCGQRLTMDEPNRVFEFGDCDKCGGETNIRKRGCNYTVIMGL